MRQREQIMGRPVHGEQLDASEVGIVHAVDLPTYAVRKKILRDNWLTPMSVATNILSSEFQGTGDAPLCDGLARHRFISVARFGVEL